MLLSLDVDTFCDFPLFYKKYVYCIIIPMIYTLNTLNLCKSLFPLQSTEEEIKRLAEFLGVGCNSQLSQEICEMCSFSVMKQDKDPLEDASEWKQGEPGMYRKGN